MPVMCSVPSMRTSAASSALRQHAALRLDARELVFHLGGERHYATTSSSVRQSAAREWRTGSSGSARSARDDRDARAPRCARRPRAAAHDRLRRHHRTRRVPRRAVVHERRRRSRRRGRGRRAPRRGRPRRARRSRRACSRRCRRRRACARGVAQRLGDARDEEVRDEARVERARADHDDVGRADRLERRRVRGRVDAGSRYTRCERRRARRERRLARQIAPPARSTPCSSTSTQRRRVDVAAGAEVLARLPRCAAGNEPVDVGERGDDQVAERVAGEPLAVREAVLEQRARAGRPGRRPCATRQLRTSPGGSIPSSRRSMPDEPPSSAIVTTARRLEAEVEQAAEARAAGRCPPPMATARRPRPTLTDLPVASDVAVARPRRGSRSARRKRRGRLGERDGAVHAAGAAERDREVVLALHDVAGHDVVEQRRASVSRNVGGLGAAQHELAHRRVEPGQRSQLAGS